MKASAYFTVEDIKGHHGVKELKQELDTLHGVISVSVSEQNNCIAVDFDTTGESQEAIQKKIEKLGFQILGTSLDKHVM